MLKFIELPPISIMSSGIDPYGVDSEGYMIFSTEELAESLEELEWPVGTEAPSKYCECMIPDVTIYVGLSKQVEYCKACGKDMPPEDGV